MLTEIELYPGAFLPSSERTLQQLLFPGDADVEVVPMDSGKAALCALLRYYRAMGRLAGRHTPVLFPRWLGDWVYCVAVRHCVPEIEARTATCGVVVYHQYGYVQRMDLVLAEARARDWFVIEDCAHAIRTFARGQRAGLIGDAGVLSFSKFFPTLTGGAVVTRDRAIAEFCRGLGERNSGPVREFSIAAQWVFTRPWLAPLRRQATIGIEMGYSAYEFGTRIRPGTLARVKAHLAAGMLDARDRNRDHFVSALSGTGLVGVLEQAETTPYVLPIFGPRLLLDRISGGLAARGILAGVYQFDLRRNLLAPDFQPCVRLPVHPGVTPEVRERMLSVIRSCL